MAKLPDDSQPSKISYIYPDGRVFSVEGEELKKWLRNMQKTGFSKQTFRISYESIDWTVNYPAHDSRP